MTSLTPTHPICEEASCSLHFLCCLCSLLALPLLQMEGSQALRAHPPKAWSFLKLWSCGIWPLSSGTQFKGVSLSEKSHLSSAARNNHRERNLKAALSLCCHHTREVAFETDMGQERRPYCVLVWGWNKKAILRDTHTHTLKHMLT